MEEDYKKDRSLWYMGIGLGIVVLVMGYLTLFVDNVDSLFAGSGEEEVTAVIDHQSSDVLHDNLGMSESELRAPLIKFIEAFYRDQHKGYFDPPSYFSPITQTYFNYHNLTYKRLKELHNKRAADMRDLKVQWIVSTLDLDRSGTSLVATYWAKTNYIKASADKEISADIKYEMVINKEGKISSLRELEVKNLVAYELERQEDTAFVEEMNGVPESVSVPEISDDPASEPAAAVNPAALYEGRLYDLGNVETAPEYRGGAKALAMFLGSSLRYPARARESKVQGKVYISFIVERDGSLSDFKVIRGIGSGCDEEAIRVLKLCPPWKPGMAGGKAVRTTYVLPITFQLIE